MANKVIFHIDMNSFYASVEIAYDKSLKGKPLAIAGNPEERRGIIVTSSYEARAKGVKTTMPLWEARKLCPELIVIRPTFSRYREMSQKIFQYLREITPLIEPVSIDEGYMDVTEIKEIHPLDLAKKIQKNLLDLLEIPCSIGIAPNKFLAKTASDMKKPLGITVLRKREIPQLLWPLSVLEMYGIGAKTAEKLKQIDIHTIENLAQADSYALKQLLGINGEKLQNRANGIDHRLVDPESVNDFKSIGNSETFKSDTTERNFIYKQLQSLSQRVIDRLERRDLTGNQIQLMIRYNDRKTVTRSKKADSYIENFDDLYYVIIDLFTEHWNETPIRLLGVTVSNLIEKDQLLEQLNIFNYEEKIKRAELEKLKTSLKTKYGDDLFPQYAKDKEVQDKSALLRTSFQKDFLDDFKK